MQLVAAAGQPDRHHRLGTCRLSAVAVHVAQELTPQGLEFGEQVRPLNGALSGPLWGTSGTRLVYIGERLRLFALASGSRARQRRGAAKQHLNQVARGALLVRFWSTSGALLVHFWMCVLASFLAKH